MHDPLPPPGPTTGLVDHALRRGAGHPQRGDAAASLYQALFCDELSRWAPQAAQSPAPWQKLLFSATTSPRVVRALAEDEAEDARVRLLAWAWLRHHGLPVLPGQLLGCVLEVPGGHGLDVLAAYADGTVRFIHGSGRMHLFEGRLPLLQPAVGRLMAAAERALPYIGVWTQPRLAPPHHHLRLSLLASDGLCFGEGPCAAMARDPLAAAVVAAGQALLERIVQGVGAC